MSMKRTYQAKGFDELSTRELYDIMHLRQEVFVVEQDAAYLDADRKDFSAIHIFTYEGEQLLAYARLLPPGISYFEASIGRVVTAQSVRRMGWGRPLMNKCLTILEKEWGTSTCRISAQSYLVPFYAEYGFEICSEEYLEDGLPHFEMIRK